MPRPEEQESNKADRNPTNGSKKVADKRNEEKSRPESKEPTTFLDSNWSWSDFSSWPLSVKFFPVLIAGVAIFFGLFTQHARQAFEGTCVSTFNYGFNIDKALDHAQTLAEHDWEIGTLAEALLELHDPELSVFGADPFPNDTIPTEMVLMNKASAYIQRSVRLNDGPTLWENTSSVSDPASLGVATIMLGQHKSEWMEAATKQKDYLLNDAPRYGEEENGAISHRIDSLEMWSDAMFMVPPFLAYYGVSTNDIDVIRKAVRQARLHRIGLLIQEGPQKGLWKHILGESERADDGAWSTGNGWAAYGVARLRATMAGWSQSRDELKHEISLLDGYVVEIIAAAMRSDDDESGLLRNYIGDDSWFAETSGTALLAAAAYRAGVFIDSNAVRKKILGWADQKREAVIRHVDRNGIAKPAVNPLKHDQREPIYDGSPEGESFLLLMGSAWRDCVCAGVCSSEKQEV